ncbi:MAG: YhcH/YjgK/YiaL family protein [Paludibacter sp.]|jgi:YhcH/YjgK/YiaL family protein|nr:YhcH/YjgK/YiaL family protein [Paludibacter sp.]
MIISSLENSHTIESLHPGFKVLFDYVKNSNLLQMETGKIEIDGKNLFINNVHVSLKKKDEQVLESHEQYIDVHIPLDRNEIIGWKPTATCLGVKSAYNAEEDYALFNDIPSSYFTIEPGTFLIAFPEDAHAPLIGEGEIRKLVAKIKIE